MVQLPGHRKKQSSFKPWCQPEFIYFRSTATSHDTAGFLNYQAQKQHSQQIPTVGITAKSFSLIMAKPFCFLQALTGSNCCTYSEGSVQAGDECIETSADNYLARIKSRRDLQDWCLRGNLSSPERLISQHLTS